MMSTSIEPGRLDVETAVAHLRRRGLLGPDEAATASLLAGGVSGTVVAVSAERHGWVVKQALGRLRVAQEWFADPARTITEGRALRLAAEVVPEAVPEVVHLDEKARLLVMRRAPTDTADWKSLLLAGADAHRDRSIAERVGTTVGRLHAATAGDGRIPRDFGNPHAFEQLRIMPYFDAAAKARPELAGVLAPHVDELRQRRVCLIHGDVSPKNVLAGGDLVWLIDFEVACLGDPAFDVAFLVSHLYLKSLRNVADRALLRGVAQTFLDAYRSTIDHVLAFDERHVAALLGCLLIARVDGRSPVDYLDEAAQSTARAAGMRLAQSSPALTDIMAGFGR